MRFAWYEPFWIVMTVILDELNNNELISYGMATGSAGVGSLH